MRFFVIGAKDTLCEGFDSFTGSRLKVKIGDKPCDKNLIAIATEHYPAVFVMR